VQQLFHANGWGITVSPTSDGTGSVFEVRLLGLRIAADAPTYRFQLRARSFSTTRCLNQPETFSHHAEIREKHSLAKV
jgi:hypothetical protein